MTQRFRPTWAPDSVDLETPSAARMYDYYLGGSHNFAADRMLAEEYMRVLPDMPHIARANRHYLGRAVTALASAGIDQFLDLGSGLPTGGNVHDVAHAVNPDVRVVYVDADSVTVAHGQAMLADVPFAAMLHADLRDPQSVLGSREVAVQLDLTRPIAVLMVAVLHFVSSADNPDAVVAAYREATVAGSHLVVSHATNDYHPETAKQAEGVYTQASHSMNFRSHDQILALMQGYELLPPGLVDVIAWRPDQAAEHDPLGGDVTRYNLLAAVGRKD
ncbi:MAG TPA: SAM-dependent methyltransferase [Actinocrinis sp.]|nr:SAM-dependent methyltransferase [Actinocrinis sp.]